MFPLSVFGSSLSPTVLWEHKGFFYHSYQKSLICLITHSTPFHYKYLSLGLTSIISVNKL